MNVYYCNNSDTSIYVGIAYRVCVYVYTATYISVCICSGINLKICIPIFRGINISVISVIAISMYIFINLRIYTLYERLYTNSYLCIPLHIKQIPHYKDKYSSMPTHLHTYTQILSYHTDAIFVLLALIGNQSIHRDLRQAGNTTTIYCSDIYDTILINLCYVCL